MRLFWFFSHWIGNEQISDCGLWIEGGIGHQVRRQMSEIRDQRSEIRSQKSDVGDQLVLFPLTSDLRPVISQFIGA